MAAFLAALLALSKAGSTVLACGGGLCLHNSTGQELLPDAG
jgi:hypothetical protein